MQRSFRAARSIFNKANLKNDFAKSAQKKNTRFYSAQQSATPQAAKPQQPAQQAPKPQAEQKSGGGFGFFSLLLGLVGGTVAATYFDFRPLVRDLEKQYGVTVLPAAAAAAAAPAATPAASTANSEEIDRLTAQIATIRSQLVAEKDTVSSLQSKISTLEAERNKIQSTFSAQVAQLKDQLNRVSVSGDNVVTVVQDNPADKQEIQRLKTELEQVERKALESLENVTKDLLDAQHKLNKAVEVHKADKAALDKSLKEFQALLDEEKKRAEEMSKQLLDEQSHKLYVQYSEENQSRIQKLAALTTKVYALQHVYEANMAFLEDSQKLSRLTMAVLAFKQAMAAGIPFKPEAQVLKDLCKDDELVAAVLNSIPAHLEKQGVRKAPELLLDLQSIADEAHSASYAIHEGIVGWMYARVASTFTFRESGNVTGTTVNAKLARAEYYLKAGNLKQAVAELSDIQGEAGNVLAPWIAKANERLLVNQACELLDGHLTVIRQTILQ